MVFVPLQMISPATFSGSGESILTSMRAAARPHEASFSVSQRLEQMMGPHSVMP